MNFHLSKSDHCCPNRSQRAILQCRGLKIANIWSIYSAEQHERVSQSDSVPVFQEKHACINIPRYSNDTIVTMSVNMLCERKIRIFLPLFHHVEQQRKRESVTSDTCLSPNPHTDSSCLSSRQRASISSSSSSSSCSSLTMPTHGGGRRSARRRRKSSSWRKKSSVTSVTSVKSLTSLNMDTLKNIITKTMMMMAVMVGDSGGDDQLITTPSNSPMPGII